MFFVVNCRGRQNKKPTGQLHLAVGLCQPLKLCVSQLTKRPPPEDRLIRVDVPVLIVVIRLAFWEVAFMGCCSRTAI